jgi:hypothetical protein
MKCFLNMFANGQRYDSVAGSGFQTAMAQFLPKASGWQRSFHTDDCR